jgi:hypothetical protein
VVALRSALALWPWPVPSGRDWLPDRWPEWRALLRLRQEAAARLGAEGGEGPDRPAADPGGTVLVVTAETLATSDADQGRVVRCESAVRGTVLDRIAAGGGGVHDEFGSLVVAAFADRDGDSGADRARAVVRAIRESLSDGTTGFRVVVSAVLMPGAIAPMTGGRVLDAVVDEGMRLLADTEPGATLRVGRGTQRTEGPVGLVVD